MKPRIGIFDVGLALSLMYLGTLHHSLSVKGYLALCEFHVSDRFQSRPPRNKQRMGREGVCQFKVGIIISLTAAST